MAFLFDIDAIEEVMRPVPHPAYLEWLRAIPREDQFMSTISISELFYAASRVARRERHLKQIDRRLLAAVTVLPYDVATAREYGRLRTELESAEINLPDRDIQVAATAIYHGLALVTGDTSRFRKIKRLRLEPVLERVWKSTPRTGLSG